MKAGIKIVAALLIGTFFLNNTSSSVYDMNVGSNTTNSFNFKYTGVVNVGSGMMPLVGQLSKDGRNLYLTSQDSKGDKQLFKMSRKAKGEMFSLPEKLTGAINNGEYDIIMPSVTADERTMIFVHSANGMQNGNDIYIATKDENGNFANIHALEAINDVNISDSYPWISPDGSRIYFTKQKGSNITFYMAERNTSDNQFSTPKPMGFTLPKISNNMSCLLSNNELEVYALSGDYIYHATRKSINENFGTAEEIANTSNSGYLSGITLTDDAKEMYVFNSVGFRNTQVLRFVNAPVESKLPVQTQAGK
ncbi:MAG: hypothetical protein SFW35_11305 [Chitinophagales bacterium]|nr:hypothetical protein [Chitinophagales bacterium]